MRILKSLLILSFVLFSINICNAAIDLELGEITVSGFKEILSEASSETVSEQDFLEKFELAINNIVPDELELTIPKEAQKFRASYQALNDLYESYKEIFGHEMAEFLGSIRTENESLIINLMIYNELIHQRGCYNIDSFIEGFISLWPKKLLKEDKLEIFCYAADDKVKVLNFIVNKKPVTEDFIKKLLHTLTHYEKCAQIVIDGIDNGLINISHLPEYLDILDFRGRAELINSCMFYKSKVSFTKEHFDLCIPAILSFPNTKPGFVKWPNSYQELSTRNAIFAFAIRCSVISEQDLPEYLDKLPKTEQLQLIKDLYDNCLIKKRESITSWLEKLPDTIFRQFIEAYIEEHIYSE